MDGSGNFEKQIRFCINNFIGIIICWVFWFYVLR